MKRIFTLKSIIIIIFSLSFMPAFADGNKTVFYSKNFITIDTLTKLYINGDFINAMEHDAAVRNAGEIHLTGDLENRGGELFLFSTNGQRSFTAADTAARIDTLLKTNLIRRGAVYFCGSSRQKIINEGAGTGILFSDVYLNNDVELGSDIHVQGKLVFNKNLYLNGQTLKLYARGDFHKYGGTGIFVNESDAACVQGLKQIEAYKDNPDAPLSDLASLGLYLKRKDGQGDASAKVKVTRVNDVLENVTGGSINRYFLIERDSSGVLDDTIKFAYFQKDIDPSIHTLSNLSVFLLDAHSKQIIKRLNSAIDTVNRIITATIDWNADKNVILTVGNKNCATLPNVQLGSDTNVCEGNNFALTAKIENASADFNGSSFAYYWNGSADNGTSTFTVPQNQSGKYFVKVISDKGCENSDTITVTFQPNPKPVIEITDTNFAKCMADPFFFRCNNNEPLAPIDHYYWNFDYMNDTAIRTTDTVSHSYQIDDRSKISPTVKVEAVSNYGCRASASMSGLLVENKPRPFITTSFVSDSARTFFAGNAISQNDPQHPLTKTWFIDGDSVHRGESLSYIFPRRDTFDIRLKMSWRVCSADTTIAVVIRDRADVRFEIAKHDFCVDETVELINKTVEYETDRRNENIHFSWYFGDKGAANSSYKFNNPGTYPIKLIASAGSWQQEYADTIRVHTKPVINFGEEIRTCRAEITLKPQESGNVYQWSDGSSDTTLLVNTSGNYSLKLTGAYGCVSQENVKVILNTKISSGLPKDTAHCGSMTLRVNYPDADYTWSTGEKTRNIDISKSGIYTVHLQDNICETTDTVNVVIKETPDLHLCNDTSVCSNALITLCSGNTTPCSYLWSNGSTDSAITISAGGNYSVKATHINGCEQTQSVYVQYKDAPKFDLGNDRLMCDQVPVEFNLIEQSGAAIICWTLPDKTEKAGHYLSSNQDGLHHVYVEYANGCHASDSVNIMFGSTGLIADFLLASALKKGDSIHIINLSRPDDRVLQYKWEISNGYTTTEENPYYRFLVNGEFEVKLTVSDGSYCPSVKTKIVRVSNSGMLLPKGHLGEYEDEEDIIIEEEGFDFNATSFITFEEAKLYPNPNKGRFTVDVKLSGNAKLYCMLIDNVGRILDQQQLNDVKEYRFDYNLQGAKAGCYVLKLWSGNESREFKIIITN